MRISTLEGAFAQIHISLATPGSIFLIKFAELFKASPLHFAVLAAIGQFAQLFQPLGTLATRSVRTRKNVILNLLYPHRGMVVLFLFLPFLLPTDAGIWVFLGLFFVASAVGAVVGNLWIAWISDLFPLRIRGRFFSARTQILTVVGFLTAFSFAIFLDLFSPRIQLLERLRDLVDGGLVFFQPGNLRWGFVVVFSAAAVAGLASIRILSRQPERPKEIETQSFGEIFMTPLRDANFRRLLFYGWWWTFVVGIGSPFWGPFMLDDRHGLGMSLVETQVYGLISLIASLLVLRPWGRLIDKFGNKTCMRIAIVLGGINPLLWVFATQDTVWLVYLEAATSGIMWSGANIVATNFVLSIAPPDKRQIYSGVFGALWGVPQIATMLLSGILLPKAPVAALGLVLAPEQVLFAITGVLRWTTEIPLTWIREPQGKPVGAALLYIVHNFKIRIVQMFLFLENGRKGNGRKDELPPPGAG
jgi:MFS family permease